MFFIDKNISKRDVVVYALIDYAVFLNLLTI